MAGPVILPGTVQQDIADLQRQIHALNTAAAPQELTYSESVDNAHPMDLDFVIGNGVQAVVARLSFKFKPFRTTSGSAGGASGTESAGHTHSEGSHAHSSAAHSHSHPHTWPITGTVGGAASLVLAGGASVLDINNNSSNIATTTDATSTTPGNTGANNGSGTGGESATHTHSVGGSSLGVTEGTSTTISALFVDGVDKTSLLGGPWTVATVDLDLKAVMPVGDGGWHVVTLTPAAQGRIVAVLRLA
jgi:hypothetical protein